MTTLAQNEKKRGSAYVPVMRMNLHDAYTSETMDVIDIANWRGQTKPPRVVRNVNEKNSEHGRTCRMRALLETEHRFFGNDTETIFDHNSIAPKLKLTNREKATFFLDKRTLQQKKILPTRDEWLECKAALRVFYIEYYAKCKSNDRQQVLLASANNEENDSETDEQNDDSRNQNESDSEDEDLLLTQNRRKMHSVFGDENM